MGVKVFTVGDYISQIGRVNRSCKEKPNTYQIHAQQKYMGINATRYRVNNVLFKNVLYVDYNETYVGIVCKGDVESVRLCCDKLNAIGDVKAECYDLGRNVVAKIVPVRFLQVQKFVSEKYGSDLKNEIYTLKL